MDSNFAALIFAVPAFATMWALFNQDKLWAFFHPDVVRKDSRHPIYGDSHFAVTGRDIPLWYNKRVDAGLLTRAERALRVAEDARVEQIRLDLKADVEARAAAAQAHKEQVAARERANLAHQRVVEADRRKRKAARRAQMLGNRVEGSSTPL